MILGGHLRLVIRPFARVLFVRTCSVPRDPAARWCGATGVRDEPRLSGEALFAPVLAS